MKELMIAKRSTILTGSIYKPGKDLSAGVVRVAPPYGAAGKLQASNRSQPDSAAKLSPGRRRARLPYPSAARTVTRPRCTCESLPCGGPAETAAPASAGRGFAPAKLPCRTASWRAGRGAAELAFPYFVENSLIH